MNGTMKSLKAEDYKLSHEIKDVKNLNFQQLSLLKSEIESELNESFGKLQENNVSMESPLTTIDGFPRSDINVIEIRNVRVKIIKLRNDLTLIINELSEKLQNQFKTNKDETNYESTSSVPFAKVIEVADKSPANQAGLLVDDKILVFGTVNATNHKNLQSIGLIVKNHIEIPIELKILRGSQRMHLEITPSSDWPGQGLLGCRIIQI